MISPLSAPAAPSSDRPAYTVRLDSQLLELLREAMERAGYDSSMLPVSERSSRQEPVAPRQISAAVESAPFVPQFRQATLSDPFGHRWPVNENYFADRPTAEWIASKYGTGEVIEQDFVGSGGPYHADQREFHIRLANGRLVNAGILASYYTRNPEDRFPGLADTLIRRQLQAEAYLGV